MDPTTINGLQKTTGTLESMEMDRKSILYIYCHILLDIGHFFGNIFSEGDIRWIMHLVGTKKQKIFKY